MTATEGSGRQAPRTLRCAVAVLSTVLAAVAVGSACASSSEAELRFVDELRNRYPRMSVSVASDDALVAAGLATCSAVDDPELARLEQLGVDRQVVAGIAVDTVCPGR